MNKRYQNVIEELKSNYEKKYGFTLFDLRINERGDNLIIEGKLLLESQLKELKKKFSEKTDKKVIYNIEIVSDIEKRSELGWGKPKSNVINVWQIIPHTSLGKANKLNTQVIPGDGEFRLLWEKDKYYLIQLLDYTMGWVSRDDFLFSGENRIKEWRKALRAEKGRLVKASQKVKLDLICQDYLGLPYQYGGNSKEGIDCSGLVQRIYQECYGIILPKHSLDQMKMGIRIKLSDLGQGDLIFYRHKKRKTLHIGIFLGRKKNSIVHASLDQKKVVIESLNEMVKNYTLIGIRRIVVE